MEKVAKFEKVSYMQFESDWKKTFPNETEETIKQIYEALKLPKRATVGSAGYDIYAPVDLSIHPGEEVMVPTGIRARIREDYVLMVFPRSGLGFKYRLQMNNTVGIIDSDYYGAANEGHIFCKLMNDGVQGKTVEISQGSGMVQGLFLPFAVTEDDAVSEIRTGGLGSTTGKGE